MQWPALPARGRCKPARPLGSLHLAPWHLRRRLHHLARHLNPRPRGILARTVGAVLSGAGTLGRLGPRRAIKLGV
jgi:hypothetical protein